jgi:hypothetical protein
MYVKETWLGERETARQIQYRNNTTLRHWFSCCEALRDAVHPADIVI